MVCITILFDIQIVRQVLGFFYFTFIPGLIIVKLMRLDRFSLVEVALLSVGFSIVFLMFVGVFANEFGLLLGSSKPLFLAPLLLIVNFFVLVGASLICLKDGENEVKCLNIKSHKPLLWFILPVLSVIGAMWVNVYGNNTFLLAMIALTSLLFVSSSISRKFLTFDFYPLAIFTIGISMLFHSSLISNYVVSFGSDVPMEYFVFRETVERGHWASSVSPFTSLGYSRINSMLSVTILPTVYSIFLKMNPTWIFKVIFPIFLSLVPLCLYQVWQIHTDKKYAFFGAFLFIATSTFHSEMLGLSRQIVGEVFFALLLFVILNKEMKGNSKILCFMVFSFGLVASHYALAEIFLFFISFNTVYFLLLRRPSNNITMSMAIFFFTIMFIWYIFTSSSAVFESFISYGNYIYEQLDDFFNPAARGETVMRGLGLEAPPTIWNMFSRVFAYIIEVLIVIGFIDLLFKRKKNQVEREWFMFIMTAMVLLSALIAVPGLANTMNMTRFFHVLLFFLAPLCALGADAIVRRILKREREIIVSLLMVAVLVPYFLFQTGFVYEFTGTDSYSLPLSKHRMKNVFLHWAIGYFYETEVFGAFWVSKNIRDSKIYADITSAYVLLNGYGMVYSNYLMVLSNVSRPAKKDIIYLNRVNVVDVIILGSRSWNTASISHIWDYANRIYSNGECEIFKENFNK
ncbi:MAG: DUF2206 domain-containing protein [Candidatus Bathyarchaeia archaeon]